MHHTPPSFPGSGLFTRRNTAHPLAAPLFLRNLSPVRAAGTSRCKLCATRRRREPAAGPGAGRPGAACNTAERAARRPWPLGCLAALPLGSASRTPWANVFPQPILELLHVLRKNTQVTLKYCLHDFTQCYAFYATYAKISLFTQNLRIITHPQPITHCTPVGGAAPPTGVVRNFAEKQRKDRISSFLRKFYAELRGCVIKANPLFTQIIRAGGVAAS